MRVYFNLKENDEDDESDENDDLNMISYQQDILKKLSASGYTKQEILEDILIPKKIKRKKHYISKEELQDVQNIGKFAEELDVDDNDSEDEGIEDYKEGGYHTVYVGECLIERYIVLQKLGWGHFSTVWLCKDVKYNTYVAIKIQKSASHYLEAAFDEVEILQKAVKQAQTKAWFDDLKNLDGNSKEDYNREDCYTVQLLNAFIYQGPFGKHFCMVFEILGVNLLEIIKRYKYKGIPINLCRKMSRQILIGLHYLHKHCGIIHTDLKPENVLLCLDKEDLENIIQHRQLHKNDKSEERLRKLRKLIGVSVEEKNKNEVNSTKNTVNENSSKKKFDLVDNNKEPEIISEENKNLNFSKKNNQNVPVEIEDKNQISENENKINGSNQENVNPILKSEINSSVNNSISQAQSNHSHEEIPDLLILTDEDFEKELAVLIEEENAETSDKIKKLKKRLKRKMTRHIKRWSNMSEKEKEKYNSLKESLLKNRKQTSLKINEEIITSNRQITTKYNEDAYDDSTGLKKGFKIKIADLGNGCWTHYHFQPEIQTRQYRGPEVILGINYNETADLWSFACMLFEMLTGDFLFDPKKNHEFKKNDDHLAQMIELLNSFPKDWCTIGTHSKRYFDKDGNLKKIKSLKFWGLKDILMERYKMEEKEAIALEDFLLPMLKIIPQERATAEQMINHYWLDMKTDNFTNKNLLATFTPNSDRFNVIVNQTDCFADVSDSIDNENDDDEEDEFLIEGKFYLYFDWI